MASTPRVAVLSRFSVLLTSGLACAACTEPNPNYRPNADGSGDATESGTDDDATSADTGASTTSIPQADMPTDTEAPEVGKVAVNRSAAPEPVTLPELLKLSVAVSDNLSVDSVVFLDGDTEIAVATAEGGRTWEGEWLVGGESFDGTHQLRARARDAADNEATGLPSALLIDMAAGGSMVAGVTTNNELDSAFAVISRVSGWLLIGALASESAWKTSAGSIWSPLPAVPWTALQLRHYAKVGNSEWIVGVDDLDRIAVARWAVGIDGAPMFATGWTFATPTTGFNRPIDVAAIANQKLAVLTTVEANSEARARLVLFAADGGNLVTWSTTTGSGSHRGAALATAPSGELWIAENSASGGSLWRCSSRGLSCTWIDEIDNLVITDAAWATGGTTGGALVLTGYDPTSLAGRVVGLDSSGVGLFDVPNLTAETAYVGALADPWGNVIILGIDSCSGGSIVDDPQTMRPLEASACTARLTRVSGTDGTNLWSTSLMSSLGEVVLPLSPELSNTGVGLGHNEVGEVRVALRAFIPDLTVLTASFSP